MPPRWWSSRFGPDANEMTHESGMLDWEGNELETLDGVKFAEADIVALDDFHFPHYDNFFFTLAARLFDYSAWQTNKFEILNNCLTQAANLVLRPVTKSTHWDLYKQMGGQSRYKQSWPLTKIIVRLWKQTIIVTFRILQSQHVYQSFCIFSYKLLIRNYLNLK